MNGALVVVSPTPVRLLLPAEVPLIGLLLYFCL